jgi:hypothetical protein
MAYPGCQRYLAFGVPATAKSVHLVRKIESIVDVEEQVRASRHTLILTALRSRGLAPK